MSCVRGVTGVPLSYVIRNILNPPCEVDDPAFGANDSAYTSIDLELISRAPILGADANASDDDDFKTAMSSAATSISDFTAATQKHVADDEESDLTRDSGWGRPRGDSRDNPALAHQDSAAKKSKN